MTAKGYTEPRLVGEYLNRTLDGKQAMACENTILAVETWIDRFTGRSWNGTSPASETVQVRGDYFYLANRPIATITGITVKTTPTDNPATTLTTDSYALVNAVNGLVYLPGYEDAWATVTYTHAGPVVPDDVKQAATMIVAAWMGPALGGVDSTVKSVSIGGEVSYTFADGEQRAIPAEAMVILNAVPTSMFA